MATAGDNVENVPYILIMTHDPCFNRFRPLQNPCYFEGKASLKCITDNFGDRNKCQQQYENYNDCKKFWGSVYRERRREGLTPHLPPAKDRPEFLKKYIETGAIPVTIEGNAT